MKKNILKSLVGFLFFLISCQICFATLPSDIDCVKGMPGCGISAKENIKDTWIFSEAIPSWITWMIMFAASASVLMVMVGGVMFLVGVGSEDMYTKGKQTIIWAIVGLVISLLAFGIVKLIDTLSFGS